GRSDRQGQVELLPLLRGQPAEPREPRHRRPLGRAGLPQAVRGGLRQPVPRDPLLRQALLPAEPEPTGRFERQRPARDRRPQLRGTTSFQSAENAKQDVGTGIVKHQLVATRFLAESTLSYQDFTWNPSPSNP